MNELKTFQKLLVNSFYHCLLKKEKYADPSCQPSLN